MAPIDLNLLRPFTEVHLAGSFSVAAERLGVPRSTVSRAIAALEESLGVRLFQRTTRKVVTTAAGITLFERAQPTVAALDRSLREVPVRDDVPAGTLRVTATLDLGAVVLAEAAARFIRRYPRVKVDVWSSNDLVDLVGDSFDLALRVTARTRLRDTSLVARRIGRLEAQLYASPEYLARHSAPRNVSEFLGHEWIVLRRLHAAATDRALAKRVADEARIVCNDVFFAREACVAGAGIATLPSFLADDAVAAGKLVRVMPRWNAFTGTVFMVQPSASHVPPRVTAFRDVVLEVLQRRPLVS